MARVLVIDDDAMLRKTFRLVLETAGHDVVEAADGEAGLRAHREHGADLVLVDIFMPRRDGLEVIRALRAESAPPTMIAMSGGGDGQLDVLGVATALGATRTLRKPIEPRELLTAVREVLAEPKA